MASLTILQGPDKGRVFHSLEPGTIIGRASDVVPVSDLTASRRHAELRRADGRWLLADLDSANGTYLNNKRLQQPAALQHGDHIRIGGTLLLWSDEAGIYVASGRGPDDLVNLDAGGKDLDVSVLSSVASNDDSVIMASPAVADAVRAWRVMSQLADAIATAGTPQQLLERVMDILFEQVPVQRGFILVRPPGGGAFQPLVVRYRLPENEAPDRITTSRTIIDHVVTRREGVLCSNAASDERFAAKRRSGSIQAFGLRSMICAPIVARDDVFGVIHVDSPMSAHIYTEEQMRLVTAIGRMSGLAVENTRLVGERLDTARLAATGQTVAALSHAIKNILQGLSGGTDVVELGLARQQIATIDQGWQIVQRNIERIYNLTMNMLAYGKEREPRLELIQLNPIVRDALAAVQRRATDKSVVIRSDLEEPLPPIPLDADGIHQVVLNLVGNAIDAVARTTGVVRVATRFDAATQRATLLVGDNGPGIPPERLARLFEPFQSSKGHGGTGLGLAVTRKIVEEHRGAVDLRSEPGHGTLVTVTLPINTVAADVGATVAATTGGAVRPKP
ncbi:MAG: ATP-binding protein [Phycisphaerae bacterium]